MALLFGLLHGLGFASGLAALGLPAGEIPAAVLLFNFAWKRGCWRLWRWSLPWAGHGACCRFAGWRPCCACRPIHWARSALTGPFIAA
ncbi:MAG: HupE/UreJ family protein [Rhodocyclaceae bacterium]|nr:HupE/UreJ family protein [Rhodocyclaceae bacterium]